MVFANLSSQEKSAFFALLDEYFASRPDVLSSAGAASGDREDPATAILHSAGSAMHRALAANPEATTRLISAGLKHGVPKSSPYSAAASDPEARDAVSRVAAATLVFSVPSHHSSSSPSNDSGFGHKLKPPPPPAPARRTPSPALNHSSSTSSSHHNKSGDVDTTRTDVSSARSLFESLRHPMGHPHPAADSPSTNSTSTSTNGGSGGASLFGSKSLKSAFGAPPPMRRAPSSSSSSAGPPAPPPRRHQTTEEEEEPEVDEPEEEEEEQGEWAEALYEFTSAESTDLELHARQRVLVVEKTSDDWWTGEINGRRGLFPASYVKLL